MVFPRDPDFLPCQTNLDNYHPIQRRTRIIRHTQRAPQDRDRDGDIRDQGTAANAGDRFLHGQPSPQDRLTEHFHMLHGSADMEGQLHAAHISPLYPSDATQRTSYPITAHLHNRETFTRP
jgi:hypothetical protein